MLDKLFEQSCSVPEIKRGCTIYRKHERALVPICAEKVQNMCKDHLTPCNAGKIQLGLEVHGRMAPSRYPRTATCGILEGLRMCIQHHPTIQQLASQNHRKLKFQTATFPVVAKWAFLPWEEMRLNHTELMLDVSDSLSYSYVFISFARNSSDINHQKSTNIIKYTYIIYTHNNSHFSIHQRGFGCKSVARGHRLFDWRSFGCLEEKTRPCPDVKSVKVLL